jgi:hypothetical protein
LLVIQLALCPCPLWAEVYYAQDEALELAFPDAEEVKKKTYILTAEQLSAAEKLAKTKIDSKLFTLYSGVVAEKPTRYAAIVTHTVRTHPETCIVVLSPTGEILQTVVLAFHEPPEYLPSKRWLAQFEGKKLSPDLWPGKDIAGIFGSTLTSQATTGGIRKVLALFQLLVLQEQ